MNKCQSRLACPDTDKYWSGQLLKKMLSELKPDSLNKHQWGKDPDAFYKSWSG